MLSFDDCFEHVARSRATEQSKADTRKSLVIVGTPTKTVVHESPVVSLPSKPQETVDLKRKLQAAKAELDTVAAALEHEKSTNATLATRVHLLLSERDRALNELDLVKADFASKRTKGDGLPDSVAPGTANLPGRELLVPSLHSFNLQTHSFW